ncbi:hypothetical protein D0T84_00965 [Dysgonomonas sp. 521]|uniref:hypothetical protein n=1 Tax=Dysgonomonas sp. 521 TaxID=2302932 RepID=UPI0013D3F0D7|nr:hypothetical protein [Dysgonomonas sp. 521]NDV93489.1 hypothetical protein [Dysgonomonas sp. 521]
MNIVTFEQAKKLKKLGFDRETSDIYWMDGDMEENYGRFDWNNQNDEDCISAPSASEALQWIRDNKGIYCGVGCGYDVDNEIYYHGHFFTDNPYFVCEDIYGNTYHQAESDLLDAVLTYLIEKI